MPQLALQVGVDARCLNTPHVRGMGKYVSEMLAHVASSTDIQWHFFGDRPESDFQTPVGVKGTVDLFNVRGYRFHAWEQIGLPRHARQAGLDVLHCTATTLPFWQTVPTVVTIHDTLPWQEEQRRACERWYLNTLIPAAIAKCAEIITISESSRADIIALWPSLEPKLHVIPHGIGDAYLKAEKHALSRQLASAIGPGPYFLYVGGALPRKRFAWSVKVVESLTSLDVRLVACGFSESERSVAMASIAADMRRWVTFLPFVSEADMPALYGQAVAVLYPTLYEGFGLPALEAQAVGTPVLFSPLGSLKELEGPLARILPPNDLGAWVNACRAIIDNPTSARSARDNARTWAKQFSWTVSANRHIEIYRRAAAKRGTGHSAQQSAA